ncbi:hypothetical protein KAU33_02455 [Candidatus Dependentiae bacterium]|nr:hypothetical protein [Candidatus Dependentiae bacterium]
MIIKLSEDEKKYLNEKFEVQGSTPEIIEKWLAYEARLLENEMELVFLDFLEKRNIFDQINKESVQKEIDNSESTST